MLNELRIDQAVMQTEHRQIMQFVEEIRGMIRKAVWMVAGLLLVAVLNLIIKH